MNADYTKERPAKFFAGEKFFEGNEMSGEQNEPEEFEILRLAKAVSNLDANQRQKRLDQMRRQQQKQIEKYPKLFVPMLKIVEND